MADDLGRMEAALREAAKAGDNAAATRIAQAIRNRRADEDQPATSPASSAQTEPADPLASVPTELGGVTLDNDTRQAILKGRGITDPKEKRLLAARIAGRVAARSEDGNFADQFQRSEFGAALRGFGAGLFGLGDLAAAGGTALKGVFAEEGEPALSFGEALEAQREFRRALEEDFPISSTVGEVAGAITGGGVATGSVRAVGKAAGGKAGQLIEGAATLQRGKRGVNALRLAGAGALAGGITEGITENDPAGGATTGAITGPLGAGVVRAAGVTKDAIKRFVDDPAAKGLRALADKLGEKPQEIARRFLEFQEATGKKPSIADIANPQAVAELRDLISERTGAVAIAREAGEAAQRTRAGEVAEQLAGGRVTTTGATQRAARNRVAGRQFAEAENDPITFEPDQVQDLLSDADLRRALPATLRRRLDEALDVPEDEAVTLTGLDVNDLRLALRDRARGATGADRVFGELADEVEGIARDQSPAFARAIDEFRRRSVRAEGVEAGRQGVTARTGEFQATARGAVDLPDSPQRLAALRVGLRSGVADTALESASQVRRIVGQLSEDSGLVRRLQEVLPEREVTRLQRIGQVQARAIENLRTLAPGVRAEDDSTVRSAVKDAVSALVVAGGQTGGAFKASLFSRALQRLTPRISDRVAQNLARDAFDPNKTGAVITALRRAGADPEDIIDLYTTASAGGILAASDGGDNRR